MKWKVMTVLKKRGTFHSLKLTKAIEKELEVNLKTSDAEIEWREKSVLTSQIRCTFGRDTSGSKRGKGGEIYKVTNSSQ